MYLNRTAFKTSYYPTMPKIPFARTVARIRGFAGLWQHRRELRDMITDARAGQYRISFLTIVATILALIYVISPIDIIPGFLFPIIGLTDDLVVIYFLTNRIGKELERYRAWHKPGTLRVVHY